MAQAGKKKKGTARRVHKAELVEENGSAVAKDGDARQPGKMSKALVGRTTMARMLGVSPSTFIRHLEGRVVEPIVDGRGWHRFSIDDIETVRQSIEVTRFRRGPLQGATRQHDAAEPAVDRATYVTVLELLDTGVPPVEIAKKLKLFSHELDPISKWWTQNQGGYFVSAQIADDLWTNLGPHARRPALANRPKDATKLRDLVSEVTAKYQILESDLDTKQACKSCRRDAAMYCPKCAQKKFGDADGD